VAAPRAVEVLIAQEQVGTAVVAQAATHARASDEIAAGEQVVTPAAAQVAAAAQAGIAAGLAGTAVARDESVAAAGQVAAVVVVADESAAVPALAAAVAQAAPAAAAVEWVGSQAGPAEFEAGQADCRDVWVESQADRDAQVVFEVGCWAQLGDFPVDPDGSAGSEVDWVQSDASPVGPDETQVWRSPLVASRADRAVPPVDLAD
jgi:hypothetical protein